MTNNGPAVRYPRTNAPDPFAPVPRLNEYQTSACARVDAFAKDLGASSAHERHMGFLSIAIAIAVSAPEMASQLTMKDEYGGIAKLVQPHNYKNVTTLQQALHGLNDSVTRKRTMMLVCTMLAACRGHPATQVAR